VSVLVILVGGVGTASAAVIHEPFDYDTGNLIGENGGIGFAGAWSATVISAGQLSGGTAQEGNLAWGNLQVSGNHVHAGNEVGGNWSNPFRSIGTQLGNAGLLNNGTTLWFSYVGDVFGQNLANLNYNFALSTAGFDEVYATRLNLEGDSQEGIGVSNSGGTILGAYWQDSSTGDGTTSRVATPTSLVVDSGANSRFFMVGKIEWGATVDANETLTLYAPGTDLVLGTPILNGWQTDPLNQGALNTLAIEFKGPPVAIDEIRFGATYEAVVPVPEPATMALLAVGGAAFLRRRRRRS
jgi:hypothetical protein